MELTINRKNMLDSLQKINGSVKQYVIISAKEKAEFAASNDSTTSLSYQDCDVKKNGDVCVDFQKLISFTKNYQGESVEMKVTKAGWLSMTGENVKFRLPGVEDKPIVTFEKLENFIEIDYNEVKNAINLTEFSIGTAISMEGMLGLNIKSEGGSIFFSSASAGHMSARYEIKSESKDFNILVPRKTIAEIERTISGDSKLFFNESFIQLESPDFKLKSRLLNAKFPNIDKMYLDKKYRIKINREELVNFLGILMFSDEKDIISKFVFSDKKLTMMSKRTVTGDCDAVVDCDYDGDELQIGVNVDILKKALSGFNSLKDEFVYLNIDHAEAPITITCDSLENYKTLIMPVRIKW